MAFIESEMYSYRLLVSYDLATNNGSKQWCYIPQRSAI